ncbi:uncharacterized protein MONOS_267 [Monocercomonoides exilis]|uniref:uncharacterized protein n=1 Tax=Monocercomonoides exilis TaxID=2049356 RepID=UPI00355A59F6|nr:hypothetical protein MONOS_267 [Monocercomonoides exilis]|eukprot:MONOS_267.1-p1 / transcript=MONOS_267.1 / gene=MONOS_267 / organism=Monocercomonoides_exilis_PA203 / gene_product=unspecified product / transcript_product=unspecified product / location=Mono_scaffold00004:183292-184104(+) / protein_length=173 / sequence_SO=supercontig / SO=protein_coding / is_pseudo=false
MISPETLKAFIAKIQKDSVEKPAKIQGRINKCVKYINEEFKTRGAEIIPKAEQYVLSSLTDLNKLLYDATREHHSIAINENMQITVTSDQLFYIVNQLERKKRSLVTMFIQTTCSDLPSIVPEGFNKNPDEMLDPFGKQNFLDIDATKVPPFRLPSLDLKRLSGLSIKTVKL